MDDSRHISVADFNGTAWGHEALADLVHQFQVTAARNLARIKPGERYVYNPVQANG